MKFYSKSLSITSILNVGFKFKLWIYAYRTDKSHCHSTPLSSWLQKHGIIKDKMQVIFKKIDLLY